MAEGFEHLFNSVVQFIKNVVQERNYPIDRILESHLSDEFNNGLDISLVEKLRQIFSLCDEGLLHNVWESILCRSGNGLIRELFQHIVKEKRLDHSWHWGFDGKIVVN